MSQNKFISNAGTPTVPKYRSIVQPDGSVQLVDDGVTYLDDYIQSFEEQCNINNVVKRFLAGDVNALGSVQGTYADITMIPNTRQAALQSVLDAQAYFEKLPADVKLKFGNSWEAFYLAVDTPEFAAAVSKPQQPLPDAEITDPVSDESR